MHDVELVADTHDGLGEGPVWDAASSTLWWVDVDGRRIHRLSTRDGAIATFPVAVAVSGLVPRASGGFMALAADGPRAFAGGGLAAAPVAAPPGLPGTHRLNDGGCDAAGRLWFGTVAPAFARGGGRLYALDPDGRCALRREGLTLPNGIAWSPDEALMYVVDTVAGRVDVAADDALRRGGGRWRPLLRIDPADGKPDGLAVDREGGLWVALWDGGAVRRYTPDGRLDAHVEVPAQRVTSCAFGGPDLEWLYITTAAPAAGPAGREEPSAGGLFRCLPGVTGSPVRSFQG